MHGFIRNMSIRIKLGLIILFINLVLLLLVSAALLTNERIRLEQSMDKDLMLLAQIVGANSSVGLLFDDPDTVRDILSSLEAKTNITEAHVFNEAGVHFAQYIRDPVKHDKDLVKHLDEAGIVIVNANKGAAAVPNKFVMLDDVAQVFRKIDVDGRFVGLMFIESDLEDFNQRLFLYGMTILTVLIIALLVSISLAYRLQTLFTTPVYNLLKIMKKVSADQNYSLRTEKINNDEFGQLVDEFNTMLEKVQERDHEIHSLNALLQAENKRMGAELDIAKRLQQLVLPKDKEIDAITGLDIAPFMESADEVGGDYYDVLQYRDRVVIGIGDVTGHGLESGVLMLMAQTAIRTLTNINIDDSIKFLNTLNKTLHDNVMRIGTEKSMTLSVLSYAEGQLSITGQHEDVLLIRQGGHIERIDTDSLGFMVGLMDDIESMLDEVTLPLEPGEGVVLYTDGITEAHNNKDEMYGTDRLCKVIQQYWNHDAKYIQQMIINDVYSHTGDRELIDDVTLLVIKRVN